ncbi:hypothetical protein [Mesorhizobium intechi]|uniref:hypothetical protein n=1 Tax=Mesorhizobium intechi TaxID=537601 RepID=UPI00142EC23B|nr:hypothetical protein [Mesorhizobium intechi]
MVLPEHPDHAIACRLETAHRCITNLIAAAGRLCFGLDQYGNRSRLDNPQKTFIDVDAQSSESRTQ